MKSHRNLLSSLISRLPLLGLALAGANLLGACGGLVDNSGGEPPTGDAVTFRLLDTTGDLGGTDDAAIVTAASLSGEDLCRRAFGDDAQHPFCSDNLDLLDADEQLVLVTIQLGGCLESGLGVNGVYLDGDTVNVHYLRADYAYGMGSTACTDDLGAQAHALAVKGVDDASAAELFIGTYNPDLPGGPDSTDDQDAVQ